MNVRLSEVTWLSPEGRLSLWKWSRTNDCNRLLVLTFHLGGYPFLSKEDVIAKLGCQAPQDALEPRKQLQRGRLSRSEVNHHLEDLLYFTKR